MYGSILAQMEIHPHVISAKLDFRLEEIGCIMYE